MGALHTVLAFPPMLRRVIYTTDEIVKILPGFGVEIIR